MTQPTLFERIGGEETITRLVDDFYDRVLADPDLEPFFRHASMDKLRTMQREFFNAALGGPVRYSGLPLSYAHHGRGIRRPHFARFVQHLFDTLRAFDIGERETADIIDRINTYMDEIMGGHGLAG